MSPYKRTLYIFFLYLVSLAFSKWWRFPLTGFKLQLSEVVFLVAVVLVVLGKIPWRCRRFDALDWGVAAMVILGSIGALGGALVESIGGVLGWWYLFAVYLLFSRLRITPADLSRISTSGWTAAAVVVSLGGILGWLVWHWGLANFLVVEKYLPYLGENVRARSFVRHPDVMLNLIVYAFIFQLCHFSLRGKRKLSLQEWGMVLVLTVGALLSYSKFLVLLPALLLWLVVRLDKMNFRLAQLSVFVLMGLSVAGFLLATHFFWVGKDRWGPAQGKMGAFITDEIVWENDQGVLLSTAYLPLKRWAVKAGGENVPFGLGMGQFSAYLARQQPNIPAYDVHSSYFGLWAESGLLGGLGGVGLLVGLGWAVIRRKRALKTEEERLFWIALTTMLGYVLIEGLVLDGLHFRHHWFLLALVRLLGAGS